MKQRRSWIVLLMLLSLLTGCRRNEEIPLKMVRWIHVEGSNIYNEDDRYFYQTENLNKLLLALRLMGQTQNPIQDPNTVSSPEFCITMCYSNGQTDRMYVKGDRYIRAENGPWRQVDAEKMAPLHYLLHFMSGDAAAQAPWATYQEKRCKIESIMGHKKAAEISAKLVRPQLNLSLDFACIFLLFHPSFPANPYMITKVYPQRMIDIT